jgi:hypothetical protein
MASAMTECHSYPTVPPAERGGGRRRAAGFPRRQRKPELLPKHSGYECEGVERNNVAYGFIAKQIA